MPSSRNRRAPRIQATLGRLATKGCEKCGLAARGQIPQMKAARGHWSREPVPVR